MAYSDCVHCGLCLNACPTYLELGTETDSPRGRIYLMERTAAGEMELDGDVVRHLDLCLGCRACESACPSGVRYGELIEAARVQIAREHPRSWRERWLRRAIAAVFPYPARLRLLLAPARLLDRFGLLDPLRRASATIAMLPSPFLSKEGARGRSRTPAPLPSRGQVSLFAGCISRVLFAETNAATRRVMNRNGFAVEEPQAQGCCGALHLHAGDIDAAREIARHNIAAFAGDAPIVVNAAGCGAMLKEYGHLLRDDPFWAEPAAAMSRRVRDASELLVEQGWQQPQSGTTVRVTYHDACHLAHAQGIRAQPRALLRSIPGVELAELAEADVCCGSAGSYNLTEPEMAQRLGARKAANIAATGAACVAVGNPGCALQIAAALRRAGSKVEVVHPIELLDRAYRSEP